MSILNRVIRKSCFAIALMSLSSPILATTIVDQIGYADGYGMGINLGQSFDVTALADHSEPGPITNVALHDDSIVASFNYTPIDTNDIEFAALEVTYAGTKGMVALFYGNLAIVPPLGTTTDGALGVSSKLTISLDSIIDYLDGSTDFSFIDLGGQITPWAIDYVRLVISDESRPVIPDAIAAPVPEPSSLAILGLGIAGLTVVRRKKLKGSVRLLHKL